MGLWRKAGLGGIFTFYETQERYVLFFFFLKAKPEVIRMIKIANFFLSP